MCCGQKRSELKSSPPKGSASLDELTRQSTAILSAPAPAMVSATGQAQRPSLHPANGAPPVNVRGVSGHDDVVVRYLETSRIRVRGTVTGRHYEFSAARPFQPVDARDVTSLLQTRFFRRS